MIRVQTGILLFVAVCLTAFSQSPQVTAPQRQAGSSQLPAWLQDRTEVLRQIDLREAVASEGERTRADGKSLAGDYSQLAFLYVYAGLGLKAEDAFQRAIALLKDGPQDQLANRLAQFGTLQAEMGEFRQAEKTQMKALEIRRSLGDLKGIAFSESMIAGVFDDERKFARARDYSQKAYDALAGRTDVTAAERIEVSHTLGFALTGLHNCDRGISVLQDALEMARSSRGWGDASVGYSEYMLGIGYWHCNDRDHAAVWLQRGTSDLKAKFGLNYATYVYAMKQYALFLRQYGKKDEAVSAESVVRQAESVVDVNTLTDRTEPSHGLSP